MAARAKKSGAKKRVARTRAASGRKSPKSKKSSRKAKKKMGWGGRRPGAGRPKGSGKGPSPNARKNRVAVMFTDSELAKLEKLARKQRIPVATLTYRLIEKSLERA